MLVGLRPGILVSDHDGDRSPEGVPFEDSREDLRGVRLLSLGREAALARPTTIEVVLDLGELKGKARRAAVDDDAHGTAMRFTERGNPKSLPEVARHGFLGIG